MRARKIWNGRDGKVQRLTGVESACGKAAYASKKQALSRAAIARRDSGELIRAYKCPHGCHAWHIGHPPGTRGAS